MTNPRHFLDIHRFDKATLRDILNRGQSFKSGTAAENKPLTGKTLVMIFEKPSTRTRVSFEVGMRQLGGDVVVLNGSESQLGRGESVADTARVLSRFCDAIMIRTDEHDKLHDLATHATVPVINGLTDNSHPCQLMADIMTFEEHKGSIEGRCIAWAGDGNNMANSWIHAAARMGFGLRLGCPEPLMPKDDLVRWAKGEGADILVTEDINEAVADVDAIVTDTWVSMGDDDALSRHNLLAPYRVDDALMAKAKSDAVFLHCLPAHRGEEVTEEVIDGPRSLVWDEAENRLHAQKGILAWCLDEA